MSATAPNKPKLHSALTADEARESIILDFTKALRSKLIAAGIEGQHITLVNAQWVGGVKVKAFLRKPADVKVVGELGERGEFDSDLEIPVSVERVVGNPEEVRDVLKATTSDDAPKSEFPLSDVVEGRDKPTSQNRFSDESGNEVAPFILSRGEPPHGVDLSEIESEIVITHDTFVDDMAQSLTGELDEGLASHVIGNDIGEADTASLCQFCSQPLSHTKAGVASHMRKHVREGIAAEYTDGNHEKAWRPI